VLELCAPEPGELAKRILATLLGIDRPGAFNSALLDAMSREVVLLPDVILDTLMAPGVCGNRPPP